MRQYLKQAQPSKPVVVSKPGFVLQLDKFMKQLNKNQRSRIEGAHD
jgi:hypothetical protein